VLHDPELATTIGCLEDLQEPANDAENLGGALFGQSQDQQAGIVRGAVRADVGEIGIEGYAGRRRIRSWESSAA
jgi:hypothetical protein